MQAMQRAMAAYGQASETMAPAKQIVLLYDGAIRRTREARAAIEQRRISERYTAVQKASAIIEALHACLDHDRGGQIAQNLDRLYTYLIFRLQRINLTDDVAICDEVIARLIELRGSWAQLAGGTSQPGAAVVPRQPPAAESTTVTI